MTWEQFISVLPALVPVTFTALFCAVMDTLAHHFDTSVFKKLDSPFWNPLHRWNDAVSKVFSFPLDAWHIAKLLMICSFLCIPFFPSDLKWYWQFIVQGCWFMIVFNTFYNKILR